MISNCALIPIRFRNRLVMHEWLIRGAMCAVMAWACFQPQVVVAQIIRDLPKELQGVDVVEHAGEQIPLDLLFIDHKGQHVSLKDFFNRGRPVVLTMNYSNCPMLCNLQLTGLVNGLRDLKWNAGQEFEIVSVSLDPMETPERAGQTFQKYFQLYGRAGTGDGWHFLVGKQENIAKVANAIGMQYQYLHAKREYSHPAMCVVCTPDGRISRYMYGIDFPARTLQLAFTEAGEGKVGSAWDRILLFCLHYDDATGRYTPAVWKIMRLAGITTLVSLVALVLYYLRREKRALKQLDDSPLETLSDDSSHEPIETRSPKVKELTTASS